MPSNMLPTLQDVVDQHMCSGCGACAFAYPDSVNMQDTLEQGRRPNASVRRRLGELPALPICPGVGTEATSDEGEVAGYKELRNDWGPVLEIWEGYATDEQIRHRGSSGGVTTALSLCAIEQLNMKGALHTKARDQAPLLNETTLSKNREELLAGSGCRYSPASPCDGLAMVATSDRPCVFVGKPCDVAAASKARNADPNLDVRLGFTMAIFCAGTPSTKGTFALARSLGVDHPEKITSIRYRGNGWPGAMTVTYLDNDGKQKTKSVEYAKGWGETLQKHRQWRCHVCTDHTGETADISIGDPWYRPIEPGEAGRSLVLVRTERGQRLIRKALETGYVNLERRLPEHLNQSQPHLRQTQAAVWGRTFALKMAGVRTPVKHSWRRFYQWVAVLNLKQKIQSVVGTVKRIKAKRLHVNETQKTIELPANAQDLI